jgi:hypothetical protein
VSLKDSCCVAQTKQHDCKLVGLDEALQGSANLLAFFHADLVVGVLKINLGEPVLPAKFKMIWSISKRGYDMLTVASFIFL